MIAIEAEGLAKDFDGRAALSDVELSVPEGTVLGLLGPNGAGKTTTVRILTTLLCPDRGEARVAGFDVRRQPREVRRHIGLSGQYAAVDDSLTGAENIILLARLSRLGRRRSHERARELLVRFGLTDAADRAVRTYSGGMRRRLDLAACLITEPKVLFLDEPTTGLDPVSRASLWALLRDRVTAGATVLLTTQYLDEADQLADRLVVVDRGQVIAEGSPEELKRKVGGERLELVVPAGKADAAAAAVRASTVGAPMIGSREDRLSVQLAEGIDSVGEVASALRAAGVAVVDWTLRKPTLDDVFFQLTGVTAGKDAL